METIAVFFVTTVLGAIIWGLRLESKVNVAEQRHNDLRELISVRFDGVEQRLDRIERLVTHE